MQSLSYEKEINSIMKEENTQSFKRDGTESIDRLYSVMCSTGYISQEISIKSNELKEALNRLIDTRKENIQIIQKLADKELEQKSTCIQMKDILNSLTSELNNLII